MAKSMLSLYNGPWPNEQFHSTYMFSNTSTLHVD